MSASDPEDVEVLWDELPSVMSQVGQRMADSMDAARAAMGQEQVLGPEVLAAASGMTPDVLAANAKRALALVQDPAQRRMLIQQYRVMGIDLGEDEEAP